MRPVHCAVAATAIVHDNMMIAIGKVLGDAVTPEVRCSPVAMRRGRVGSTLCTDTRVALEICSLRYSQWRAQIGEAWSEAVSGLAKIMIEAEEQLNKELEARPSGWRFDREFVVRKKEVSR